MFIIFGAGKKGKSKTSSFNDMIEKSAQGKPITVSAEPGEKISIQYVKDSAKAVVCGCLAALDKKGIYNTGGNDLNYSKIEIANKIKKYVNYEIVNSELKDKDFQVAQNNKIVSIIRTNILE